MSDISRDRQAAIQRFDQSVVKRLRRTRRRALGQALEQPLNLPPLRDTQLAENGTTPRPSSNLEHRCNNAGGFAMEYLHYRACVQATQRGLTLRRARERSRFRVDLCCSRRRRFRSREAQDIVDQFAVRWNPKLCKILQHVLKTCALKGWQLRQQPCTIVPLQGVQREGCTPFEREVVRSKRLQIHLPSPVFAEVDSAANQP
jgi:hypothetical protein